MNHIRKEARTSKRFPWYITPIFFLIVFLLFFSIFVIPMGVGQAINTLMNTAYYILMNTVFYIMAIAVIAGAISELLSEYGVVRLINVLQFKSINFSALSFLHSPTLTSIHDHWKNHSLD